MDTPVPKRKPASPTKCSKCDSNNTQSFEMAWQTGTSGGTIKAGTIGGGTAGFGVASTSGKTSSQSLLAEQLAPPTPPTTNALAVFGLPVAGFIVGLLQIPILGTAPVVLLPLVGFVGGIVISQSQIKKAMPAFEKLYARWQRSWICLKCGHAWQRF